MNPLNHPFASLLLATMGTIEGPAALAAAPENPQALLKLSGDPASRDAKALEEMAYSYGLLLYQFGLPYVYFDDWRARRIARDTDAGRPRPTANSLTGVPTLMTARESTGGAPNVDTLYSWSPFDLAQGPVEIDVPATPGRYAAMQIADASLTNIGYISHRTQGDGAGRYLLVGPDWKGRAPRARKVIQSPTNEGLIILRVAVKGDADLPDAQKVQDRYRMSGPPAATTGSPVSQMVSAPGLLGFYDRLARILERNPLPERDRAWLSAFMAIGFDPARPGPIGLGNPAIERGLTRALEAGPSTVAWKIRNRGGELRGWTMDFRGGDYGGDFLSRAAGAIFGLVVNSPQEAIYFRALKDSSGRPLDGARTYTVTLPQAFVSQCAAFWSLTSYDSGSNLIDNADDKYAVVGRDPAVAVEPDGAIKVAVGGTPAADRLSNWMPATQSGPFAITFRCYQPGQSILHDPFLERTLPMIDRIE
ncbi:hypothetical protein A6F68_02713 [Tsuneonella dongtanensis]|uniref:DUF1254 domain-containing protein n=1 Tax=Tsuneonella dongtanensis TaxID=692370 RepID=A0A1B2AGC1_9SPHN|nr:DUF1254 domain-containing protein [Tsuneonella dongtanensis]ANY21203.1 hypothetical protein A6F68_02713 [Tsuneonella dongtanensis]